ncbi:hypothetical protein B6D60_06460 [candidate division KSB1 bacterium 4484_87]|nr:MAG: hypothetical protein B6D60_06460 [candidate division KSB1 bacterium 4484_87]
MRRLGIIFTFLFLMAAQGFSQYYFGRNKVIYNNFTWYILKTEHFDIYYYPEMRELAEIGGAAAEESYRVLEDKFNHSIDRRIPLIFYSNHIHFQQTNTTPSILPEGVGGFFEFIKGRVVIPANGSIPDFKRVIRHELVHVFTHSLHYRILKDHHRTHFPALPLWYVEGLAEYWSIGWNEEAEMFIKDAVLHNYLVPLESMYQIYGTFLMYKEGQAILKYIADQYGEEKIIQLIRNTWKEESFSNVLKLTIQKDYRQFDKEWLYHLKKKYYPIMAQRDFPEMVSQKITFKGINTKPAFFRKNNEPAMAFVSNRIGYSNIYRMMLPDLQFSLKEKEAKIDIVIKGERTADFESFHILNSKIDVNNRGELCFVSKSGATDALYICDVNNSGKKKKFRFPKIVTMFSPSWSPDNQFLVFSGIDFSGKCDLFQLNLRTGNLTRLTNDYFNDRDAVWDATGKFIFFSSDRTSLKNKNYYNLFALRVSSGEIFHLTYGAHNDYAPAISAENKYLAFTSDRDGAMNIWVIKNGLPQKEPLLASRDLNISRDALPPFSLIHSEYEIRKITNFTTGAQDPEWTDDNGLLFTAFENFSFQIQLLNDVPMRYDSSKIAVRDSIFEKTIIPSFDKIVAHSTVTTVKYKPKFNLDVAQSAITQDPMFGTSGGAQLAISDMLGNYQYHFLVFNNAQTRDEFLESFNVAISRLDLSHRTNYAIGLYHFAGRYFNWYDGFFYERWYGGFGSVSYPLSTFERIEGNINFRQSYKEWYGTGYSRSALLLSNFIGYVKDNSLWGPTGPLDGERIDITIGNTTDVRHSNVNFYTIIFDARKYFRLSRQSAFAFRAMTRYNHGKEALPFYMGGSWDLRGYRRWSLWGKKIFLINNELRFPFIDRFLIKFPFGGMTFSAIRGAAFVDVGNAWDDHLTSVLGSAGLGVRFRFGGVLVLRFDFGKKFAFNDLHHLLDTDKFDLQSGYFKQFFFGWDF